jgi:glutamate:GABA antiporter
MNNNKKALSVFSLVMINVIAIDSLRSLPANAETGLAIIFYYLAASIIFLLPYLLITAELSTHYPKTGGVYVWVREAFGPRWAFVNIWLQWIYNVIWYPTILSFVASNIAYLFDPSLANSKAFILPITITLFTLSTLSNCYGIKVSSWVSTISAIGGTIIPMLAIIGLGALWVLNGHPLAVNVSQQLSSANVFAHSNIAYIVVIFFSLIGFEMSATHAGDVKNPKKDYPKALLISAVIIVVSLILASSAIAIIIPKSNLNLIGGLDQALILFLNTFHLNWLSPVFIVLIILGAFGGISAWVIGPTRSLMVAARDECFPKAFAKTNKKQAPVAILIAQLIIVVLLCCGYSLFKQITTWYWILTDLSGQLALIFYVIMFLAAIKLRYKNPNRKPGCFQIPGGKVGIWVTALVGVCASFTAIIFGFFPASGIQINNVPLYHGILFTGLILLLALPLIIYQWNNYQGKK